jgi:hypothetical protein
LEYRKLKNEHVVGKPLRENDLEQFSEEQLAQLYELFQVINDVDIKILFLRNEISINL